MHPIAVALDKLQGDDVSLGFALPTLVSIKTKLAAFSHQVTIAKPLLKKMEESLATKFDHLFDCKEFLLAAVTVPRFKLAWLKHDIEKKQG